MSTGFSNRQHRTVRILSPYLSARATAWFGLHELVMIMTFCAMVVQVRRREVEREGHNILEQHSNGFCRQQTKTSDCFLWYAFGSHLHPRSLLLSKLYSIKYYTIFLSILFSQWLNDKRYVIMAEFVYSKYIGRMKDVIVKNIRQEHERLWPGKQNHREGETKVTENTHPRSRL